MGQQWGSGGATMGWTVVGQAVGQRWSCGGAAIVGRAMRHTISHALDVCIAVEEREWVLQPNHIDVGQQHRTAD